jgi:adenylate kinase
MNLSVNDGRIMRYKSVLLFGAPGSGKGTQGKIIGTIPGFFHTACGDIFRSLDLSSEMGRIFWEYSSRGQLVPDEFTVKLWKQYIKGMEMIQQFRPLTEILVLDGIPRNVEQARLLEDTLDVVKIIHLQCSDLAKMVERLRRRALKENRFDDANDEVIQKRLMVYDVETKPVLDYYPTGKVAKIDATMSQMRVLSEIVKLLVPLKEPSEGTAPVKKVKADSAAAGAKR